MSWNARTPGTREHRASQSYRSYRLAVLRAGDESGHVWTTASGR